MILVSALRQIHGKGMNTPSIRQMRARMMAGHRQLLEAARDGRKITTISHGAARGYQTCRATLIGWGCIEGDELTDTGRALLAEYLRANPGARST